MNTPKKLTPKVYLPTNEVHNPMERLFLDTNLIIRFLTKDAPKQAEKARQVFVQLEAGTLTVTTSEAVIVEAVHILSSKVLYNVSRQEIRRHLRNIIILRGLKIANKKTYLRALDLYVSTNIDFVDALSVAHMERAKLTTILSFDRDFDKISSITRQEP